MTGVDWNDRVLETALQEVCGSREPKPLGARIVAAGTQQRRAARERVARAAGSGTWRRVLPIAAVLLLGIGVVLAVSWVQRRDTGRTTGAPQDPQRAVPADPAEFEAWLGRVRGMRVRQCFYSYQRPDGAMARIDIDQPGAGFVPVEPVLRADVLAALRDACRRGSVRADPGFEPELRLVLELDDGRDVHCVIDYGTGVRVLAGRDLPLATGELTDLVNGPAAASVFPSLNALGIAPALLLDARDADGQPLISRQLTTVRLHDLTPDELFRLGEFTQVQELDLSGSAESLAADSDLRSWVQQILGLTRKLDGVRRFALRSSPLGDEKMARLLERTRNVEEVDLANCRNLGKATLQCLQHCKQLRAADLRGCGFEVEDLTDFAHRQWPEPPTVRLSAGGYTAEQRARLERAFDERLRWD